MPRRWRTLYLAVCLALVAFACVPENDALQQAATRGDNTAIEAALDAGTPVDVVDDDGATLLVRAILARRPATVRLLLDRGAEPGREATIAPQLLAGLVEAVPPEPVRVTPLMLAALVDDTQTLELLLERGAVIDSRAQNGFTALHVAAAADHGDTVRLLVNRGADLRLADADGRTAQDVAEEGGQRELAEYLGSAQQERHPLPIDVAGHFSIAAAPSAVQIDGWALGSVPVGIAVDASGRVYWSEFRRDRIRSARADGGDVTVVGGSVPGPLGIAVSPSSLRAVYASDRYYPRSIGAWSPGTGNTTLYIGPGLNRPFAVAVDAHGRLYWSESINGRIRSMAADGSDRRRIFDDGISSIEEQSGLPPLQSYGVAVDPRSGDVFWTDLLGARILRAGTDGGAPHVVLDAAAGLEMPTALAIDATGSQLYWADPAAGVIATAGLDGSDARVIAGSNDRSIDAYGLALDPAARRLFWTDIAADAVVALDLATSQIATVVALGAPVVDASDSKNCLAMTRTVRDQYLRRSTKAWRTCLLKVGAIQAVKRRAGQAHQAAPTCLGQLGSEVMRQHLQAAIESRCGAEQVDDVIAATLATEARIVAADYPRVASWLREVRPFMEAAAVAATEVRNLALSRVDEMLQRLREAHDSGPEASASVLPASGQETSYGAWKRGTSAPPFASVADDGALRAGAPMRYFDNGDGTITDRTTGLMWEKKCDGCGWLHDFETAYRLEGDADSDLEAWLKVINGSRGTALAGYDDWRLPTVEELLSLVDFEHFNPAVASAFDGARCGLGCSDTTAAECSCTRLGNYWTSSRPAGSPGDTAVVSFNLGLVGEFSAERTAFARAVRAGKAFPQARFERRDDGTIFDRHTRLLWEEKTAGTAGLHDCTLRHPWSADGELATIWDWLDQLNRLGGTGFAGYTDWRIPNVKELFSLVDYRHLDPAVAPELSEEPSCTEPARYWTSTTFSDFPAHAWIVDFAVGRTDDSVKNRALLTRAVRGPLD